MKGAGRKERSSSTRQREMSQDVLSLWRADGRLAAFSKVLVVLPDLDPDLSSSQSHNPSRRNVSR